MGCLMSAHELSPLRDPEIRRNGYYLSTDAPPTGAGSPEGAAGRVNSEARKPPTRALGRALPRRPGCPPKTPAADAEGLVRRAASRVMADL